jgi:RNase H-fold protein (predicted Holliday junction resolvase)
VSDHPPSRPSQSPNAVPEADPEGDATVLAIDPGSAKCGVAVVRRDGQALFRAVITADSVVEEIRALLTAHRPRALLVGAGTGSKPLLRALEAEHLPLPIQLVDEAHTSEAARARFVAENTPPGLQRLLPRSLRTPWRAYDDYVAIILAERFWQESGG